MGGFHGTGSSVSCTVPSFDSMHFHYYLTAGSGPVPVVQLISETDRVDLRERENAQFLEVQLHSHSLLVFQPYISDSSFNLLLLLLHIKSFPLANQL